MRTWDAVLKLAVFCAPMFMWVIEFVCVCHSYTDSSKIRIASKIEVSFLYHASLE